VALVQSNYDDVETLMLFGVFRVVGTWSAQMSGEDWRKLWKKTAATIVKNGPQRSKGAKYL
jgi:hypothetical protein